MHRLCVFCGMGFLGLTLLVGAGSSQEGKKDVKITGMLPTGFKNLGLSKAQINQIYQIQTDFRGKYAELKKQMEDLKVQESKQVFGVLTKDQLNKYLEAKGVDTKKGSAPAKDKKADPDAK